MIPLPFPWKKKSRHSKTTIETPTEENPEDNDEEIEPEGLESEGEEEEDEAEPSQPTFKFELPCNVH